MHGHGNIIHILGDEFESTPEENITASNTNGSNIDNNDDNISIHDTGDEFKSTPMKINNNHE